MKALYDCHVLVTPNSFGKHDPGLKTTLAGQVGRVTYNTTGKPLTSAELQAVLPEIDGFIAGLDEIDAAALACAEKLRVIARYGVGINNVDLQAAAERGIVVTNTPGANAVSVAELAIGLMFNLLRPIYQAAEQTRQGGWPRLLGSTLSGKTVGLIGLGAIGREVARRLNALGCRCLAYDVAADRIFAAQHGVALVSQEDLLRDADIVSLHLPLLAETRNLVSATFLQKMKPGAYLINTSRGGLVDETALYEALTTRHLAGAALDAFQQEPPPADNPLLNLPQVIPTPHMGAHTDGATNAMGWLALNDCLAVLRGDRPRYPV